MYRLYKSTYYLHNKTAPTDLINCISKATLKYSNMGVPYYATTQSFTFQNWVVFERLANGLLKIDDLDAVYLESLLHTILPGGRTILHTIYSNEE